MPFEKGKSGNSRGRPPRGQSFADAVRIAVLERGADGRTKLRQLATVLVDKGVGGDIQAIREVAERLDGKAKATIESQVELRSRSIVMQITPEDEKAM